MVPATDSANTTLTRRVGLGLTLLALVSEPGCARLRSFRQDDRPAFGTETAPGPGPVARRSPGVDTYADRVGQSQGASRPSLAQEAPVRSGEADPGAPPPSRNDRPVVALQPPVTESSGGLRGRTRQAAADRPGDPPVTSASTARASAPRPAAPTLEALLRESRQRLESLTSYQVNMSHQERVAGTLNPAEDVVLSIRRTPKAVRLEWPTGPNKGREVLYAADANGGLMHVRMPNPLIPQLKMPPDSPLATRNSRHPITEAGFDTILQNMELAFARQQAGDASLGKIDYAGMETPEGFDQPCHKIVRVTPAHETWVVYLDPTNKLPALVQATAGNQDLLERYQFRDPRFNLAELATAQAFDPDSRWGQPKGLFQRIARGSTATPETESR